MLSHYVISQCSGSATDMPALQGCNADRRGEPDATPPTWGVGKLLVYIELGRCGRASAIELSEGAFSVSERVRVKDRVFTWLPIWQLGFSTRLNSIYTRTVRQLSAGLTISPVQSHCPRAD
jgi:hypothetical protein